MKAKKEKLVERYKTWSSEELIKAATLDRSDYLDEALRAIEEELERRNLTPEELHEGEVEVEIQQRRQDDQLRGIGGWLAFFLIVVGLNSLIGFVSGLYWIVQANAIGGFFFAAPELLFGVYGFFALALLLMKRSTAPRHAARWLFISAVYYFIVAIITLVDAGRLPFLPLFGMGAVVWLTYLQHSRRVLLTYGGMGGTNANTAEHGSE